jgi:hypothetical protein
MSEEQQPIQPLVSKENQERINNAFFAKSITKLPMGVLIEALKNGGEAIDVAITNADIADIYNEINGESPFDKSDGHEE